MTTLPNKPWYCAIVTAIALTLSAHAQEAEPVEEQPPQDGADEFQLVEYPIAILPFRERGQEVKEMGGQVADLTFAKLVADPSLFLVDREEMEETLGETELNLSGIVKPDEAIAVGQLTGARLLVTGSVFQVDHTIYLVAKIIGTETSRVVGASVKGPAGDGIGRLAENLGDEIIRTIKKSSDSLVAKPVTKVDRIAALKKKLGGGPKPALHISIQERHVGRVTIDPAAETELTIFCRETGFTVVDADRGGPQQAGYLVQGEGMSEFARRHGNLISVKARLEVKVVDRATGEIVAVDRQTRVAVDLVEQIAGKQALQEAAADIAERILPKLIASHKE